MSHNKSTKSNVQELKFTLKEQNGELRDVVLCDSSETIGMIHYETFDVSISGSRPNLETGRFLVTIANYLAQNGLLEAKEGESYAIDGDGRLLTVLSGKSHETEILDGFVNVHYFAIDKRFLRAVHHFKDTSTAKAIRSFSNENFLREYPLESLPE